MKRKSLWFCAAATGLMLAGTLLAADLKEQLTGKWGSPCHEGSGGKWVEDGYEFSRGDHFRRDQRIFTEKACPIIGLYESRTYLGYYKIGGPVKDEPNVRAIDFTITQVGATAYGEKAVKDFNSSGLCKITDWKQGQKRDITGVLCKGQTVPAGTVVYDAVSLEGDQLFFGDRSFFRDSANIKNRPDKVDRTTAFLKGVAVAE